MIFDVLAYSRNSGSPCTASTIARAFGERVIASNTIAGPRTFGAKDESPAARDIESQQASPRIDSAQNACLILSSSAFEAVPSTASQAPGGLRRDSKYKAFSRIQSSRSSNAIVQRASFAGSARTNSSRTLVRQVVGVPTVKDSEAK